MALLPFIIGVTYGWSLYQIAIRAKAIAVNLFVRCGLDHLVFAGVLIAVLFGLLHIYIAVRVLGGANGSLFLTGTYLAFKLASHSDDIDRWWKDQQKRGRKRRLAFS